MQTTLAAFKRLLDLESRSILYSVLLIFPLLSNAIFPVQICCCVCLVFVFLGCPQFATLSAALVVYKLSYFLAGAQWSIASAHCISSCWAACAVEA